MSDNVKAWVTIFVALALYFLFHQYKHNQQKRASYDEPYYPSDPPRMSSPGFPYEELKDTVVVKIPPPFPPSEQSTEWQKLETRENLKNYSPLWQELWDKDNGCDEKK